MKWLPFCFRTNILYKTSACLTTLFRVMVLFFSSTIIHSMTILHFRYQSILIIELGPVQNRMGQEPFLLDVLFFSKIIFVSVIIMFDRSTCNYEFTIRFSRPYYVLINGTKFCFGMKERWTLQVLRWLLNIWSNTVTCIFNFDRIIISLELKETYTYMYIYGNDNTYCDKIMSREIFFCVW